MRQKNNITKIMRQKNNLKIEKRTGRHSSVKYGEFSSVHSLEKS